MHAEHEHHRAMISRTVQPVARLQPDTVSMIALQPSQDSRYRTAATHREVPPQTPKRPRSWSPGFLFRRDQLGSSRGGIKSLGQRLGGEELGWELQVPPRTHTGIMTLSRMA
jgi:hypothetical protein